MTIEPETEASSTLDPVFEVVDNVDDSRFELRRDDELVGFAAYRMREGAAVIPHVETLLAHRGQGYAARLMEGTLEALRSSDRTVVPLCPFAAQHIRDNPQHHDLLA